MQKSLKKWKKLSLFLVLISSRIAVSAEDPKEVMSQIRLLLSCGQNAQRVGVCSEKYLSPGLSIERQNKIKHWLIRNYGMREPVRCNDFQSKVIKAAGYTERSFLCLQHMTQERDLKPGAENWGFLNYDLQGKKLLVYRLKDK